MKEFLMEKIQTSQPYTNAELDWLLENIGHPDPTIRDELVYASFAISFGGLITREQAQSLLQFSQETKPFSLEGPTQNEVLLAYFTVCCCLSIMSQSLFIMHF